MFRSVESIVNDLTTIILAMFSVSNWCVAISFGNEKGPQSNSLGTDKRGPHIQFFFHNYETITSL